MAKVQQLCCDHSSQEEFQVCPKTSHPRDILVQEMSATKKWSTISQQLADDAKSTARIADNSPTVAMLYKQYRMRLLPELHESIGKRSREDTVQFARMSNISCWSPHVVDLP
jgi:citrate synthase